MIDVFNKFKALYANSLRVKSLVFVALASAMILGMYGWSILQNADFEVTHGQFEFIDETGGGRVSPAFIVKDTMGVLYNVQGRHFDCFYRFELDKPFKLSFVSYGGDNVVVACSQGKVSFELTDGLAAVSQSLKLDKLLAKSALVTFFLSVGGLFSRRQIRALFGW